jgi:hypothetical protein
MFGRRRMRVREVVNIAIGSMVVPGCVVRAVDGEVE